MSAKCEKEDEGASPPQIRAEGISMNLTCAMKTNERLSEVLLVAGRVRNIAKTHVGFCRLCTIVSKVVRR
jgi:hypothetical protein